MNAKEQMEAISNSLDIAIEYGMEVEVIYFALMHMKKNPDTTPVEAFLLGITELIK
jgi:hypothetical protein